MDAAIQLLSPVLGSFAAVTLAALGLDGVSTVVLVAVVLVVVFVLGDVAAGFTAGSVVGLVPGRHQHQVRPSRHQTHRPPWSPPPRAW